MSKHDLNDDDWSDLVRGVNAPPEVPRDRMWERIDAVRREQRAGDGNGIIRPAFAPHRSAGHWWRLGGAIAAVLVLGIAIGRMTVTPGAPDMVAGGTATVNGDPGDVANIGDDTGVGTGAGAGAGAGADVGTGSSGGRDRSAAVFRLAAADLFDRADVRLTDFRGRTCGPDDIQNAPTWAAGMLLQTRLLLDTDLARDPTLRPLLDELELVLAQIVGLSRDNCARDMALITGGLKERATLNRLRLAATEGAQRPL